MRGRYRRRSEVPRAFDVAFLEWFRNQTEAEWAALPVETPDELVSRYVGWGVGGSSFQRGTCWKEGLPEDEIADLERRLGLRFPPDYRLFLERLHAPDRPMLSSGFADKDAANTAMPVLARAHWDERQDMVVTEEPSFYNWSTDDDAIAGAFEWLSDGLEFDVEANVLWEPDWGPKPASREARRARIRELVAGAPKLVPVIGHRYLLAEPHAVGNPVFSVYQSDIIVYETDLRTFLIRSYLEFKGLRSDKLQKRLSALRSTEYDESYYESIPLWGSLLYVRIEPQCSRLSHLVRDRNAESDSLAELNPISGVGEHTLSKYGRGALDRVARSQSVTPTQHGENGSSSRVQRFKSARRLFLWPYRFAALSRP